MSDTVKLLIVDDSADDAELLSMELLNNGFKFDWQRVDNESSLRAAYANKRWDVVLCDIRMPNLTPEKTLEITREIGSNIPVLIVSGTVQEEKAVNLLKSGASDFLSKDNLTRLPLAIRREILGYKSREALQASEERYALAERAVNDGLWDWNIITGEDYLSPRWKWILGYQEDELPNLESSFFNLIHPDDKGAASEALRRHLEENARYSVELRLRHKDGSYRWILSRGEAVRDADGRPVRMVGSITDISKRKRAEEQIQREQQFTQSVIESMSGIFYLFDQDGTFVRWNRNFQEITSYDDKEITHGHILDFVPEDERAMIGEHIQEVFENGSSVVEGHLLGKYAVKTPYLFAGTRVQIEGKQYLSGTGVDITNRKRMEQELRESQQKFLKLFMEVSIPLCFVNEDGVLIHINHHFTKLFGYTLEDIPTLREWWIQAFPEESYRQRALATWETAVQKALENGTDIQAIEYDVTCKNSKICTILIGGVTFGNDILATFIDVTERKRAEDEILKACDAANMANKAKSAFLATMSHEIRTPMNVILGMSELIQETKLSETQKLYIKTLKRSGETLLALINDILDLSKIEAGNLSIEHTVLDLRKLVDDTIELLTFTAMDKGIELNNLWNGDVPHWVLGDPTRLRQVLLNLIGNAIKFTKVGQVDVHVDVGNDNNVSFVIKDTGPGIPKDKQEEIFQPFTQADISITRSHGGTGLGLNICRRLASLMKGSIRLESKVGKGSKFIFCLPLPVISADEIPKKKNDQYSAATTVAATAMISGCKILIAEDVEENQMVILGYLKKIGCRLVTANNGAEALKKFKNGSFNLVLMDIQMPIMDGYTAVRKIRKWEKSKGCNPTPIVALTAHTMPEDSKKIKDVGCDLILAKPISKVRLMEVLHRFLLKADDSQTPDSVSAKNPEETLEDKKSPKQTSNGHLAINREVLQRLHKDFGKDIVPTLKKFTEKLPIRLNAIADAIKDGNPEELSNVVHKLKGAAATFGANSLADLARQLEMIAKSDHVPNDDTLMLAIMAEGERVQSDVEKILVEELQIYLD
ncbi:MAG: PAS domain S-box protein [Magnetococcales bacterium]|nr:PAS domain S-box protein [Magnetococcales bacterium]